MCGLHETIWTGIDHALDPWSLCLGPDASERGLSVWRTHFSNVFAGLLGWSAWKSIAFARAFGSYSVGYIEIETWIPQVPMLAGAFLLIVAAAARLFTLVAEHRGR